MFIANLLIALREGLEAALIVSILVAYLVKSRRTDVLPKVVLGVVIAIAVSLAFGAILTYGPKTLTFQAQEIIGGSFSLLAVVLTTGMIFWMSGHARSQKGELEGKMATALESGASGWSIAVIALVAVGREGLETALFVWATVKSSVENNVFATTAGLVAGLAIATLLGVLIYKGAIRINLGKFFTVTGYFLILVAAGIAAYGIHDFQEAGVLPGLTTYAWDVSYLLPAPTHPLYWLYIVLSAMFQLNVQPTVLEVIAWCAYVIPVTILFYRATRRTASVGKRGATVSTEPTAAEPGANQPNNVSSPSAAPAPAEAAHPSH